MSDPAVVTGAGSGIDRASAEIPAGRGLHVVGVGRTSASVEDTRQAITAHGGTAECVAGDAGHGADLDRVVSAVGERPIAVIVHAAGSTSTRATPPPRAPH